MSAAVMHLEHEPDFNSPAYVDELVRVRPDLTLPYTSPHNRFVRANHWKPHWGGELSMAVGGIVKAMLNGYEFGGLTGAYEALDSAHRYRDEAQASLLGLATATVLGIRPKAGAILAGESAMAAMSDYLLATDELARNRFMPHHINGRPTRARQRRLARYEADIRQFSLPQVSRLYGWNVVDEQSRFDHWDGQIQIAETVMNDDGEVLVELIRVAIDEAEIVTDEDIADHMRYADLDEVRVLE